VTTRIRERAGTLDEAFARAALALFALAVDPATVEERDRREVRAHGRSREALLAHWLSECVYVLDVEGFACARVEFPVFDVDGRAGAEPMRVHAFLVGEEIDPVRHHVRAAVEPVATSAVTIRAGEAGFEVEVGV
jgi:SHS2 domain-containing protein